MRQSDLFVQSSRWEGFGNVIVEAMACNAPIVSTDCPSGPAEILEDGRWGEIVPVGNVDLLAQAILRKLKKNPTNQEYIRASQFSVKRAADQYLSLFNKIGWKK
jgi:glycosyltransferase involved in cell wall biosynthesis